MQISLCRIHSNSVKWMQIKHFLGRGKTSACESPCSARQLCSPVSCRFLTLSPFPSLLFDFSTWGAAQLCFYPNNLRNEEGKKSSLSFSGSQIHQESLQIMLAFLCIVKVVVKLGFHTRFPKGAKNNPTMLWTHCCCGRVRKKEHPYKLFRPLNMNKWKKYISIYLMRCGITIGSAVPNLTEIQIFLCAEFFHLCISGFSEGGTANLA